MIIATDTLIDALTTLWEASVGRQLAELAISQYGIRYVEVNEQNPQAIGFYKHIGFEVFERTEFDEQGNPFPILKMKLR